MQDILNALPIITTKRSIKKRSIILYQGEVPRAAYVLKSGVIKAYSVNRMGEEQIVSFHTAGDMFPAPWIFGKASSSLYYYETLSDCELLSMPKQTLVEAIYGDKALLETVLSYFINNYTGLLLRITALEQSRAVEKILFTLYYLLFRYGKEVKPGVFTVQLTLTQSVIAGMVGLTRETTASELNKLRRKGVLTYAHHQYTINKIALEKMLGEDSFTDISLR